ncbi:hypothetical protein VNI00_008120 [Paramarasmius palmivorus]|uniref:Heme haloperoxidase family profile domain-containing protein n=1 Tax=Paramarasmius palmivorus TaxID=297713 RepID=A0AAW0CYX5_9AGAR
MLPKFFVFATAFLWAAVSVSACPPSDPYAYRKPSSTDSRSPCPWINSLANHGYLPRDGKNITIPAMLGAVEIGLKEVFNVAPEVVALFAKLSVTCSKQLFTFDLNETSLHGCIEHDASISRSDFNVSPTGDNTSFNETLYQTLASKNPGKDFYDIAVAGQVMKERLDDSLKRNEKLVNTQKEFNFRATEAALYLSVMGKAGADPKEAKGVKIFIDTMFREDRLPIKEGWKKPETKITGALVSEIVPKIQEAAQPWVATGGQYEGAVPFTLPG